MLSILPDHGLALNGFVIPNCAVRMFILIAVAAVLHAIAIHLILPLLASVSKKSGERVANHFLLCRRLLKRTFHLLPAMVVSIGLPLILNSDSKIYAQISKALNMYYIFIGLAIYDALLTAIRGVYIEYNKSNKVGINGTIQALQVLGVLVAITLAVSLLVGKSPIYFLSGLGAFTAILILIFKDAILGFVAGIQLSTMDLVRIDDWIQIPKHGADGPIIDITLTTVKVRNFDLTVTAIPAYELVSSSFKNFRNMFDSGGRRIKRSMRFNVNSIHFLTDEEMERLRKIKLLRTYFDTKVPEIEGYNDKEFCDADMSIEVNGRRLTNIGTFRAYCLAYLRGHPGINQKLMLMVRQLEPTELGLPLELYAFTNDVMWVGHESVQSDIFDHLLAIAPVFGLVIYQR